MLANRSMHVSQVKDFVERVVRHVEGRAPPTQLNLEELRLKHPQIGCSAPTCALHPGTFLLSPDLLVGDRLP